MLGQYLIAFREVLETALITATPKDDPLHHKGLISSILAVMPSYTVNAEWARVIVHLPHLAITLPYNLGLQKPTDK